MTVLRGECAKKFERQVKYGRPKLAAHKALENGNKLLAEYLAKGYATITLNKT